MAMFELCRNILKDTRGASAVEYGLILSMIVIAMISALQTVANEVTTMWYFVSDEVTEVRNEDG